MEIQHYTRILDEAGVRPTPNRLLVFREIAESSHPLSLIDLESRLETVEKSSVHRVLATLVEHDLIHSLEDGRGIVNYELCHAADHHHSATDMHAHFYCERCHTTFCLDDIHAPAITLPEGYVAHSLNYMFKGLCPDCSKKS